MEEPNFWDNPEEAQEQMKQLSSMKEDRDTYQKLVSAKEDMETLIEMGQEEDDDSVVPEIAEMMEEFKASFDAIRIKTLLSGEFDKDNAIIKLNAGAGGTEACDWCGMLYRMYTRWAERKGFTIEELDFLDGDEAGVKSVTFQVNGENAYGYLKSEKGVHRLVRISPFNAAGKRQTSFVSCDVMPDIDKEIDVEVRDEDIRIDTYRSSGAGGQHINKTSSAIRITHMPTGIVVTCQNERSQFQNKDKAMQMLKAKLLILRQQEQEAAIRNRHTAYAATKRAKLRKKGVCIATMRRRHIRQAVQRAAVASAARQGRGLILAQQDIILFNAVHDERRVRVIGQGRIEVFGFHFREFDKNAGVALRIILHYVVVLTRQKFQRRIIHCRHRPSAPQVPGIPPP